VRRLVVLSGVLFLFAPAARAEEPPFTPRLELAVGPEALLAAGNVCERRASDLVICSSKGFVGAALGFRGRIARHWSVGVRGTYDWAGWTDGLTTTGEETRVQSRLWRLAADGRWHLRGDERFDPYLELNLGLAKSWSLAETPSGGTEHSPGEIAPSIGAAVGFDMRLLRHLSFGSALGAQYLLFGQRDLTEQRESGSVFSEPSLVWSLGVTLAGRYHL
jgi:hypothetical protein